jgi:hypothetical protein
MARRRRRADREPNPWAVFWIPVILVGMYVWVGPVGNALRVSFANAYLGHILTPVPMGKPAPAPAALR